MAQIILYASLSKHPFNKFPFKINHLKILYFSGKLWYKEDNLLFLIKKKLNGKL